MSAPKFVHCNSLLTQKPKCSFRNIKIWLHYSPIWYHLLANNAKPLILPVYSPKAHNPLDTLAFGLFLELALLFSPQSFPLVPSPVKGSLQIFKSWLISQAFPDYLSRLVTLITFFFNCFYSLHLSLSEFINFGPYCITKEKRSSTRIGTSFQLQ